MRKKFDPLLKTMPWKLTATFDPLERVLHQIRSTGTVQIDDSRQVVYREDAREGYYDVVPAIQGIIEFFEIAATRHGISVDVQPFRKLAHDLDTGADLYEDDLDLVSDCINACKKAALGLRLSQADDIVKTIQISMEMEKLGEAA